MNLCGYLCQLCFFIADNLNDLKVHEAKKHQITVVSTHNITAHHCPKCQDMFYSHHLMLTHIENVHTTTHTAVSSVNATMSCPICHKTLANYQLLKTHIQMHHLFEPSLDLFPQSK